MADTDSDTEIQFNFRNEVHDDGQGDVMRQAPVQTDGTIDKESHQDPIYMSEPGRAQNHLCHAQLDTEVVPMRVLIIWITIIAQTD